MRRSCLTMLAAVCLSVAQATADQGNYPSRPITIVSPFPAGASIDVIARLLAERMRTELGQPIVVENIAGASGSLGTAKVARSTGDGYVLGIGNLPTHVLNGAALRLNYDVVGDFEPIALLTTQPLLIVAKNAVPAKDLREFIAWLKTNPGSVQGTSGPGSIVHLAGVLFQKETGTRFGFVPYRGAPVNDLLAGHIDFTIDLAGNSLAHVRAGAVKAYAVTSKSRLATAPEVATVDEAGLPGFHILTWFALFAPKGTPAPVIATLNAAVVKALSDPGLRTRFAELGQEVLPREQQTPEALRSHQKAEIDRWWPTIKATGPKPD